MSIADYRGVLDDESIIGQTNAWHTPQLPIPNQIQYTISSCQYQFDFYYTV